MNNNKLEVIATVIVTVSTVVAQICIVRAHRKKLGF